MVTRTDVALRAGPLVREQPGRTHHDGPRGVRHRPRRRKVGIETGGWSGQLRLLNRHRPRKRADATGAAS